MRVAWNKGLKLPSHSEETKEKIRLKAIGRKHTLESRKKMSISHAGKPFSKLQYERLVENRPRKEKCYNWKGGKAKCSKCGKLTTGLNCKLCRDCYSEYLKNNPFSKGPNAWNWKGGTTPLYNKIRALSEFISWRKEVFKKDNYTCQECFIKGCKLEAHHIKPFAKILAEFLKEYSQFSPIEDKETLLRLAVTYKPFWEVLNGKTLCSKKCHKKEHFNKLFFNSWLRSEQLLRNLT